MPFNRATEIYMGYSNIISSFQKDLKSISSTKDTWQFFNFYEIHCTSKFLIADILRLKFLKFKSRILVKICLIPIELIICILLLIDQIKNVILI